MNERLVAAVTELDAAVNELLRVSEAQGNPNKPPKPPNPTTPVESPEGTTGPVVVDSQLATWTINGQILLRDGVDSTGRGSTYLYHDHQVFTLGTDNNWWVWPTGWAFFGSSPIEPPPPDPNLPTESPDGTRGLTVTDSKLAVWTIDPDKHLLRDGVNSGGMGTEYMYSGHYVYTLGMDNQWWIWRDRWEFFGEIPNAPPVHGDQNTQTCVNLQPPSFFSGSDAYINRFQRSNRWWNIGGNPIPGYVERPDNYVDAIIPPGGDIYNLICVQDVGGIMDLTEQRAGKHVLLWKTDLNMSIHGAGVEPGVVTAKGRYEFEIPPTIKVDGVLKLANPALNLMVSNRTDHNMGVEPVIVNGVQYPALIHIDDEADFLAGKTFTKAFFNSLSGAKTIRNMQMNCATMNGVMGDGTNTVPTIEPHHFMKGNSRTFEIPFDQSLFYPPEMYGVMAREGNLNIFNTVASKYSDAALDYWGMKFSQAAGPNWLGDLLSEFGNEDWNSAWPYYTGYKYMADLAVSMGLKVVNIDGGPSDGNDFDKIGCAAASRGLSMWTIMERYVPRARHKRVMGAQWAWTGGMGGMLAYVDPATNTKVSEMADYYAGAPYWGCDLADVTLDEILDGRLWETQPAEWWIERCTRVIDQMTRQTVKNLDFLKKYAPNLKLTMYEGNGWLSEYRLPTSGEKAAAAIDYDHWMREFMDGAPGRAVLQHYWDTFVKGNFALFNAYEHQGYTFGVQTGLKLGQYRPDTPRQALFRTFGK